jgi:hypothetical protein
MSPSRHQPPRRWKAGERCLLRSGSATLEATVAIASSNAVSLGFSFESWRTAAGLYVNGIALIWQDDGYRSLETDELVTVEELPS